MEPQNSFGARRTFYNNFASHLLNAYNPNMFHPALPYRWTDEEWFGLIDMIAGFGYDFFEFWLIPGLFCRDALESPLGRAFARQMTQVIHHAHEKGVRVEMLCALATVGPDWHTYCPGQADEWRELQHLWSAWIERLPGLDVVGIFPGDPGGCSRHGCTAEMFIDKSLELALLLRQANPQLEVELHTWGPPFFAWGLIEGPPGWQGEFVQAYQHTAWRFDNERSDSSMQHLLRRLPEFPSATSVAINMGFNPDGMPGGDEDACSWAREIARTNQVFTWDFSLTEGENAVLPHYRLDRLFERRREERAAAPYSGGICFSMTPRLNQLSMYAAARSFLDPDADPRQTAADFCTRVFGEPGRELIDFLPLFEVIPDWGNHAVVQVSRDELHAAMRELGELLADLEGRERDDLPFFPSPAAFRRELLFFARLFSDLTGPAPDFDALRQRYWQRVYAIYDSLPEHVDPRPHGATDRLIRHFVEWHANPR